LTDGIKRKQHDAAPCQRITDEQREKANKEDTMKKKRQPANLEI
jgi:hypothetical protein